jgi:4-amino-4-deoxy-L-arabinose transferase-like glycosyltransferase
MSNSFKKLEQCNTLTTSSAVAISLITLFSFFLRYCHAHSGLPYLHYWDEPQIAIAALNILKTGDFNPHFFAYGSLPIYLNYWIDVIKFLHLVGQPETSVEFLTNLKEIKTHIGEDYWWEISHPSFYFANRTLSSTIGALTVLFTYLSTKKILNSSKAGLVSALFLALLPYHIELSSTIKTDVYTTFFGILVLNFSLSFLNIPKFKYFLLSLIFVGLAIASKYNSAVLIIVPITALLIQIFSKNIAVGKYILALVTIPILTFYIAMPYALLDSAIFLNEVGLEIRHYKILGHGGTNESIPGIPHLLFQIQNIKANIGSLALFITIVGVISTIRFWQLLTVLGFIVAYTLFMSQMIVNFHRNFLITYPYISILFASGIYFIYLLIIEKLNQKYALYRKWVFYLFTIVISTFFLRSGIDATKIALNRFDQKESRSQAIEKLNSLQAMSAKIIIAKELRVHPQDLSRLNLPYEILSLNQIFSCKFQNNQKLLFLLPSNINEADFDKLSQAKIFNLNLKKIPVDQIVFSNTNEHHAPLNLDIFSINPGFLITTQKLGKC